LVIGLAGGPALTTKTHAPGLTFVVRAKLLRARVGYALELATVLVLSALGIVGTVRETRIVRARSASASQTLLRFGTGGVEAGQQAIAVDADPGIAALEIELASERLGVRRGFVRDRLQRVGRFLERVETESVRGARRADGAIEAGLALRDAANGRADLLDGAVLRGQTHRPRRRGLRIALVPAAEEAAAVTERTVGNADIAGVVAACGDPEKGEEEDPETIHGSFDALALGIFIAD